MSKDRVWPFSFENLCDALDLDARKLRRRLLLAPGSATVRPTGPVTTRTDPRGRLCVALSPAQVRRASLKDLELSQLAATRT